ncbi:MAG: hypothetical protein COA57_14400 [Flavobacteriales bacterium]|nr:DUF4421 family protein [Bacteroidales bacterium AH-315-I05]PCJ81341.1 MAG: hypothetical protein COA57_14400 [Flavobacteriales bacterium]
MNLLRIFIFGLIFVFCSAAWGQEDEKKKKKKKEDNEWIEQIDFIVGLKPHFTNLSDFFIIHEKKAGSRTNFFLIDKKNSNSIIYRPNINSTAGGELMFKFMRLSYDWSTPIFKKDFSNGFESTLNNIKLGINTRIFGLNVYYTRYNGLYLMNSDALGVTSESEIFRNDINTYTIGIDMRFVFTGKFSIKAAFHQSERQRKSKGGFLLLIADRYSFFDADRTLIPNNHSNRFSDLNKRYHNAKTNTFYIIPGWAYTWVAGKLSFTWLLNTGLGLQAQSYRLDNDYVLKLKVPAFVRGKAALGYNGDYFYTNLIGGAEFHRMPLQDAVMNYEFYNWTYAIGIRF